MAPRGVDQGIGTSQCGDAVGRGAPGGSNAAVQNHRDLGVGEARQIVVGHRLALLGRQRPDRGVQVKIVGIGALSCGGVGGIRNRDRPVGWPRE